MCALKLMPKRGNTSTREKRVGENWIEELWWAASELPAAYSHACTCSNGIFPGRTPWPLRESQSRENHPRRRDDHFPECFLKPKDFSPIGSHFPATSLLTPSLVDQVQRVLAEAVGPPRGTARDEAKPYPCVEYAELELQAVGSTFVSGALALGFLRGSQASWEKPARTPLTY